MVVSLSTWMAACPSWWRGVSLLEGTDAFLSGWRVSSPANFEDHPHQIYHELNKDTWMLFQKSLLPFNVKRSLNAHIWICFLPLFSPTGSLLYSVGNEELFTSDRYAAKRTNINIQSRMVLTLKKRRHDKLRINELYYILP